MKSVLLVGDSQLKHAIPLLAKTQNVEAVSYPGLRVEQVKANLQCLAPYQYIESNKNKPAISIALMTEDLKSRYREYSRKKSAAFKKTVERAYNELCSKRGDDRDVISSPVVEAEKKRRKTDESDSSSDSASESFSSENPDYVTYKDTNSMNSFLTSLYKSSPIQSDREGTSKALSRPSSPHEGLSAGSSGSFVIDRKGDTKLAPNKIDYQNEHVTKDRPSLTKHPKKISLPTANLQNMPKVDLEVIPETPPLEEDSLLKESSSFTSTPAKVASPIKSLTSVKKTKKKPNKEKEKEEEKGPKVQQSSVKFADIGGNESTLKEVCKLLVHMKHPEVYRQLGVTPPRGFLLHGPPGCGKTLLAHAIAGELELPFIKMAATEIVSGVSGESEEKLRDLFFKAKTSAPCIVFLDEIDAITQKRDTASKDMERRIVSQLLTCMDDLNALTDAHVLVIGATNRADSLDPALRRAGRFDREIPLGIPDQNARMRILKVICRELKLASGFDFQQLAKNSPGFVGADLMALAREAAMVAVDRVFHEIGLTDKGKSKSDCTQSAAVSVSAIQSDKDLCDSDPLLTTCDKNGDRTGKDETNIRSHEEVVLTDTHEPTETTHSAKGSDVENIVDSTKPCIETQEAEKQELQPELTLPELEYMSVLSWLKNQPPLSEEQLSKLFITMEDFEDALKVVQPSAKREGFATIPDVTWKDIGALKEIREELQMSIMAPVHHPEQFAALGLSNPPGILLAGPPGCGKTLLAKAIANESGLNFISVKGPELLNMYVGESERAVRQVFQRAKNSVPCVIFFDELDALCPRRTDSGEGGSSVRVVNQLLTEMDGLESRKQVFIMGATNRPDIIDPAVLRPGRLDKILYVGLPSVAERLDILQTITKNGTKPRLGDDVDLGEIASNERCDCYTGADLAALVREAAVGALRECMQNPADISGQEVKVLRKHFEIALNCVKPSVSKKDQMKYELMRRS